MIDGSYRLQFRTALRELRYGIKHDWRKLGPGIKRAIACTLVACFHSYLFNSHFGIALERQLLHQWFTIRGEREIPETVTVVRLDELAYSKLNLLPGEKFPRQSVADAVETISGAGAKLIVLDLFARRRGDNDEANDRLAKALAESPSVIGLYTENLFDTDTSGERRKTTLVNKPYRPFAESAKTVIPLQLRLTDGIVEEIALSTDTLPSPESRFPLIGPLRRFVSEDVREPSRRDYINFYGGPFSIANLSFAELLEETIPTEFFRDRVVFLGVATTAGVGIKAGKDTFITSASKRPIFGVEIQATIAANLLDGSWIRRFQPETETLALVLLAFGATYFSLIADLFLGLLLILSSGMFWLGFSFYAFTRLFYFIPGATMIVLVFPTFLMIRWAMHGYAKRSLSQM